MGIHDLDAIRGAGGGGGKKGGGGSGSNAPNSLRSKARARMVEVISEGPIVGLVDGERSIYFDQTAVKNADGSYNFDNVIWEEHKGNPDETAFKGQSAVETSVQVDVPVKNATGPVQRTIVDQNVDALRVIVRVDSLYKVDKKSGRLKTNTLEYKVEVRGNAGTWTTAVTNKLEGEKNTSPVQFAHRVVLPENGAPWDIRVTKVSEDSTDDNNQKNLTFEGYVELVEGKFIYPHSAAIAMEVNAEDMGNSIPARSYHVKGLKVLVPNNYDPVARTYDGIWNGGFKVAWTNNPAWIFYDLLINDRYGLGEFIDAAIVDKWSLYTIAQYCDQLVKSGFKNADTGADIMEPRFSYNGVIKSRDDAYFVLQSITTAWRGMAYWSLGQVFATADIPADPIKLVAPANVINGEFSYSSTALKARHSVILVKWNDPNDFYRPATEVVINQEMLAKYGWREKSVTLNGCTSRGLAHRYGKWILDVEQHETETVEYSASWDHAEVKPGDIIAIADPRKAAVRLGGRIVSHVGSLITLDYDFAPTSGETYSLMLTMPDGSLEKRPITGFPSARQVQASGFSSVAAANAMFMITGSDIVPRQYRVLALEEAEENIFKVTALFHDPQKYARVEKDVIFEPLPYSKPARTSKPPTNLHVKETGYTLNGQTYTRLTISWSPPVGIVSRGFIVAVDTPFDSNVTLGTTPYNSIEMESAGPGSYKFYVQTIDFTGSISKPATLVFEAEGPAKFPMGVVTDLTLRDKPGSTQFTGRDVRIVWKNKLPSSTDATAEGYAATDENSPLYQHNTVSVYRGDTGELLRTTRLKGNSFTYDFLSNKNDNIAAGFTTAHRSLRFVVTVTDIYGRESDPVELTVSNPVPAAFNPVVNVNGKTLHLTWTKPIDEDLSGVMVWVSTASGFDPYATTPVFDGDGSFMSFPGQASTTYYVRTAAYDSFGKIGLNISPEIQVSTLADIDFEAPAVPTGLAFTFTPLGDGRTKVVATWNANTETDLAYYDIQLKEGSGNFVGFQTSTTTYEWTLRSGVVITGKIRAVDRLGNASAYTADLLRVVTGDNVPPAVPTDLVAKGTFNAVWLNWTANTEADFARYEIYEAATATPAPTAASVASFASASVTLYRGDLPSGGTRYYWIRAVDLSGNKSAWSASVVATVLSEIDVTITTEDLQGLVDATSFAASIRPVEILSTLPTTGNVEGRTVFLTTNKKTYTYRNGAFDAGVDASQIVGQLVAGQIAAGAIGTEQLAAKAVTASKMLIGDTSNIYPDPNFEDPALISLGANMVLEANSFSPGTKLLTINPTGGTVEKAALGAPFPLDPLKSYWIGGYVGNGGTTPAGATLDVVYYSDLAGSTEISRETVYTTTTTGARTVLNGKLVTAPAGTKTARLRFIRPAHATSASNAYFSLPTVRRAASGELIVDGEIKANHLSADELITLSAQIKDAIITNAKIVELSAAKLMAGTALAGSITVSGRSIGNLTNIDTVVDDISQNWTVLQNGSPASPLSYTVNPANIVMGSRSIYVSQGDDIWLEGPDLIPFDPSKLYKMTFRVRRSGGTTAKMYLGFSGFAGDKTTRVSTSGANSHNSAHYVVMNAVDQVTVPTTFTEYSAYVRGHAATGGTGLGTIASPKTAHSNVRYFRPLAIFNYQDLVGCDMVLDSFKLEVVSEDAAGVINAGSTQIDPGKVTISGGTTLWNWVKGGDETRIDGGMLSANTVTANKLEIGSRNITLEGIVFEHNKPATNQASWTAGSVRYINDAGATTSKAITAGNTTAWTSGVMYIYWVKDATTFSVTTSAATAFGANNVVMATYRGGVDLDPDYGRTIIDGSTIKTGTVKAAQIGADQINGTHVATNSLDATHIKADAISAKHVVISDTSNMVPDNGLQDAGSWSLGGAGPPFIETHATLGKVFRFATNATPSSTSSYIAGVVSKRFPVIPGEALHYGATIDMDTAADVQVMRVYLRFFLQDGTESGTVSVIAPANLSANVVKGFATVPANAVAADMYIRRGVDTNGLTSTGTARAWNPFVYRRAGGDLIVDGSIDANKINVGQLSLIADNAGTITAGLMRSSDSKMQVDLNNKRILIAD
jgi:predicted phage tail protein